MPAKIPTSRILRDVRDVADGDLAPPRSKYAELGNYGLTTAHTHTGSWWKTVVRAGLQPRNRRPLTPNEYKQYHNAALDQQDPQKQLCALLAQFTGLPSSMVIELQRSWIDFERTDVIITVPSTQTANNEPWQFRLPKTWSYKGEARKTGLPGLTRWYFNNSNAELGRGQNTYQRTVYRIASDAELGDTRRVFTSGDLKRPLPQVRPQDLRVTLGIQMARNEAPPQRIKRHLGINHTGWRADVDGFFLWLYIYEGTIHPNYDPPDVILDPVSP